MATFICSGCNDTVSPPSPLDYELANGDRLDAACTTPNCEGDYINVDSPQGRRLTALTNYRATDIMEHWDEFSTVQLYQNTDTNREVLIFIGRCEVCRTELWLTVKSLDYAIISETRLTNRCKCDDMEAELDKFLGYNPPEDVPSDELPGMWDHSDFLGEGEWAQPTHVTDTPNYDDRGCLDTRPDEAR